MTSWQDLVLAIGGLVLFIGLLPTIHGHAKPPLASSVPIASVLFIFTMTMLSLGFWWSAAGMSLQSGAWVVLAWQRWTT